MDVKQPGERAEMTEDKYSPETPHVLSRTTGLCILTGIITVMLCILGIWFEMNRVGSVSVDSGAHLDTAAVTRLIGDVGSDYLSAGDKAAICRKIRAQSPLIADVTFTVRFPRRLVVKVIDEEYAYYMTGQNGTILLLNRDFRVLGIHDPEAYANGDCGYTLTTLTELYVGDPVAEPPGGYLTFAGQEILGDFLNALYDETGHLYTTIDLLDLRNLRGIVVIFDRLIRAEINDFTNPAVKLRALASIVDNQTIRGLKIRDEACPTRFTYVNPQSGSPYWAVNLWADLFAGYPERQ